jgi:hypothetical protein
MSVMAEDPNDETYSEEETVARREVALDTADTSQGVAGGWLEETARLR